MPRNREAELATLGAEHVALRRIAVLESALRLILGWCEATGGVNTRARFADVVLVCEREAKHALRACLGCDGRGEHSDGSTCDECGGECVVLDKALSADSARNTDVDLPRVRERLAEVRAL